MTKTDGIEASAKTKRFGLNDNAREHKVDATEGNGDAKPQG